MTPGETKWQKAPQETVDLFERVFPGPPAEARKMFGYPAGFVNGNMFMGLFQDSMVLRLPADLREEFLRLEGAAMFEPMAGRAMKEYVTVPAAMLGDRPVLDEWIERSMGYAAGLAPRQRRPRSGAKPSPARKPRSR